MNQLDPVENTGKAHLITQGTRCATGDPNSYITTLLGSCVACCLWDPRAEVGGMNHLLLAVEKSRAVQGYNIAGVADMEVLINDIIKLGGRRDRLQAKVFGGAQMFDSLSCIGQSNTEFALEFLKQENIPCVNQSVGGSSARALKFWPTTGRASLRILNNELPASRSHAPTFTGNGIELFDQHRLGDGRD